MEVPLDQIGAYGVVEAEPASIEGSDTRLFRIRNLVEKPRPEEAPSNLAIVGRYVLSPEIFTALEETEPGRGGEIQLTDGLKRLLRSRPIYGYRFEGVRYDAGDKLGFLKATVEFALDRPDSGQRFPGVLEIRDRLKRRAYSHSMVPGGLCVRSIRTAFRPSMASSSPHMRASRAGGIATARAVMPSTE